MENILAQSRSECADLKSELALRETKIEALKRHITSLEQGLIEQIEGLKGTLERKEY